MVNKVILIGNVGMDPEIRTLESGVKMARIRIATSEYMRNRETQESTQHTEWHTVVLWRGLADVVDRFVRKGSQVYVEGRLRTREWADQAGNKRYSTEILGDSLNLLGKKGDSAPAGAPAPQGQPYQSPQQPYQSAQSQPYQAPQQPYQAAGLPQDDPDMPF